MMANAPHDPATKPPDPVLGALESAQADDEPETAEERALVEQARRSVANGDTLTTAELRRRLGL